MISNTKLKSTKNAINKHDCTIEYDVHD